MQKTQQENLLRATVLCKAIHSYTATYLPSMSTKMQAPQMEIFSCSIMAPGIIACLKIKGRSPEIFCMHRLSLGGY